MSRWQCEQNNMLVVYASELAAVIGYHRYRPVAEAAIQVLARSARHVYDAAMSRNQLREKPDIAETIEQLSVTEIVTAAVNSDPLELEKNLQSALKEVPDSGTLAADITSFVFTERGKNAEDSSLDRLETQLKQKIVQRNDKYFKTHVEYGTDGKKIQLGGRVDGITEDGGLIEVKNRQRRFFSEVPLYERVQVHAYMVLTGVSTCQLVQSFNGREKATVVPFDAEFWNTVLSRLRNFASRLEEVLHDERKQDDLLLLQEFPVDFDKESHVTPELVSSTIDGEIENEKEKENRPLSETVV